MFPLDKVCMIGSFQIGFRGSYETSFHHDAENGQTCTLLQDNSKTVRNRLFK